MTALEFATETMHATSRPALTARAINVVSAFYRNWQNRRAFYLLGDMTDAELSDIGLTRADLHVAISGVPGVDPTVRLRAIVEARENAIV